MSFPISNCSVLWLVVVLDGCTSGWGHHLSLNLSEHLIAHHVHHWVHSTRELCWHLTGGCSSTRLTRLHHGLLRRCEEKLEDIDVIRVWHVVQNVVHLHLANAAILQEVLDLEEVESQICDLLHEALLLVDEVLGDHSGLHAGRAH